MDPTVKIIVDILGALFSAFGKPIVEAALGHHGYVPRRVEAILGPDDSGHASAAADELRGKQAGNDGAPEPDGGASHRGAPLVFRPGPLGFYYPDPAPVIDELLAAAAKRHGG